MAILKIIRNSDSGLIPGFEQWIKARTCKFPGSGISSGPTRNFFRGFRGVFRPRKPGNGPGIGIGIGRRTR